MNNIIINELLISSRSGSFPAAAAIILFLFVIVSIIRAKAGVKYE